MIRRNDRDRRLAGLNDRRLSGPEQAEPEFEQAEPETGGTETGIEKLNLKGLTVPKCMVSDRNPSETGLTRNIKSAII